MTDADAIRTLRSPDHFIQQLDLGMEPAGERRMAITAASEHPCDVGLLATMVDVVGGSLVIRERPQAGIPTTNIELLGLDQLRGAGEIRADARMAAMSKRRATVEATLEVGGHQAWGVAGFVVRDDPTQPAVPAGDARPPRVGRVLERPLWEEIGVRQVERGAEVGIEPRLYNNATALQGGATVALLEAAALTVLGPAESISAASINYFLQVRGQQASARVRTRTGRLVVVDVVVDDAEDVCATAAFGLTRA